MKVRLECVLHMNKVKCHYIDTNNIANVDGVSVKLSIQLLVPLLDNRLRMIILQGNGFTSIASNNYVLKEERVSL